MWPARGCDTGESTNRARRARIALSSPTEVDAPFKWVSLSEAVLVAERRDETAYLVEPVDAMPSFAILSKIPLKSREEKSENEKNLIWAPEPSVSMWMRGRLTFPSEHLTKVSS